MLQAKKENNDVAVYLEGEGLFVVAPDKMANDFTHCMYMFEIYKNEREAYRWDKPIKEQTKEQEFDKFRTSQYAREMCEKYGTYSIEVCYAHERFQNLGIQSYNGKKHDHPEATYHAAVKQAQSSGKKTAVYLNSGDIHGLFVVSPNGKNDFNDLVAHQKKLRWDKPIEQQKAEEKQKSNLVRPRGGR